MFILCDISLIKIDSIMTDDNYNKKMNNYLSCSLDFFYLAK